MGIEQHKGEAATCFAESQTQRKKKDRQWEKSIPDLEEKKTQRETRETMD